MPQKNYKKCHCGADCEKLSEECEGQVNAVDFFYDESLPEEDENIHMCEKHKVDYWNN